MSLDNNRSIAFRASLGIRLVLLIGNSPSLFLRRLFFVCFFLGILSCLLLFSFVCLYCLFFTVQFLWGLGLPIDEAECYDVYGLDEELLEMVPKPVLAVLCLYPLTAEVSLLLH